MLAIKPFKGEVDNSWPTGSREKLKPEMANAPKGTLKLKYAHGYRCHDAKNMARYSCNEKSIVFTAASTGV